MSGLRRHAPLLILAAAAVLPVHRAVFTGQVLFYRDIHLSWYPAVESFVRTVAQGSWPLWNPDPAFGQPMLADPQWMVAYPPTWLNLVVPPWVYYTAFAVAHLFWSALGTYRLCRRWRCSRQAAILGACIWSLSGPAVSLVSLYHHFASACWIPWVFLAGERALRARRRGAVLAMGGAMAGQILAGSADMTAMTWLAFAAYALARLSSRRPLVSSRNRAAVAGALLAALLALVLTAIAWLPALELVSRSGRSGLPADTRTYWSLHPLQLAEAWLPGVWHLPGLRAAWAARLFESREPFLNSIYLGIGTVPLAAAAFAARRPRRGILALVAAGALVVAFGRHFVAYDAATTLLPPLSVLRYPVKTYVMFAWAWALLCAQGIEGWRRHRGSARAWALVAAAALAVVAGATCAGTWLVLRGAGSLVDTGHAAGVAARGWSLLAAAAVAAAVAAAALLRRLRPAAGARLVVGAAAVVVLDLAVRGAGVNPTAPRQLYARPPVVDVLRAQGVGRLHAYSYMFGTAPRQLRFARTPALAAIPDGWSREAASALAQELSLSPNTAGRWALESGFEADPTGLHPRRLSELETLLPLLDGTQLYVRLLALGGITHVLSLDAIPGLRKVAELPVLLEAPLRVYEVPDPLPRAYAVGLARAETHAGVMLEWEFDPTAEVVVAPASAAGGAPGPAGRVSIVERRGDAVTLAAEMERAGFVVLLDTYDPGWRVRVDGVRQPLLRANATFRAVRVPAGRHVVEMRYRPWPVLAGAAITLIGAGTMLALWAGSRARPAPR